jgi:Family of unknown function (DUF6412)
MPAPLLLLELFAGLFGAGPQLAGGAAGIAALAVVAAGAVLLTLVVALRAVPVPTGGMLTSAAVRQQAERTAFLQLRDPDAAGRPRPRAPSARPRAA